MAEAPGAQGLLRRGDHRRRLARAGHRLLPRARPRHHRRGDPREELHRLGRRRAATPRSCARTTRPRRARASTTPRVKLYEGLSQELNFNLLFSQNGHLTLAHTDRAMFVMANRAEVNRLNGIDSRLIYPDEIKKLAPAMQVDNPDAVHPIMGALYHPPGGVIRHDAVVWGLARGADRGGAEIHPYTEVTGIERKNGRVDGVNTNRGDDQGGHGAQLHGRLELADLRHGRRADADHHPHPPGLRDRADEAAARRGDRLVADARVHLADRPRRVPDGRGDRALDHLPHAGHAQLPAGGLAATRSSCSRSSSARASCAAGRACATSARTTARSSARPRSRASTSARAGAPTASRPRRSSARRWPSWPPPARRRS